MLAMTKTANNRVYKPSALKRHRRTKADLAEIDRAIIQVLQEDNPQTVRHVYYCLVGSPYELVPKTEAGYRVVQRQLLILRERRQVPWKWISDGTRWRRLARSFDGIEEAVRFTAETYRRDLWRRTPVYVEVWCESDSIAGVLIEEADRYNVPLMVSRGFSSRTYLHSAANDIRAQDRPAYIYYVGDWDPSGKLIPEKIEETLRRFAPGAENHFERLLVTPEQITEWELPTKPAKKTTHSKGFTGGTVEAEAIPAHVTRRLLREAIEGHLDLHEVQVMKVAEESEASLLESLADAIYVDGGLDALVADLQAGSDDG